MVIGPATRFESASETRTISSTNPACFFRIGTIFSLMELESSLDLLGLHGLLTNSTARVNMDALRFSFVASLQAFRAIPGHGGSRRDGRPKRPSRSTYAAV